MSKIQFSGASGFDKGLQHLVFETGGEASELKSINNSMVQKVAAPSILEEPDLRSNLFE